METDLQWNQFAAKYYLTAKNLFGNPSVLVPKKGGVAIWLTNDLEGKELFGFPNCFVEHVLRDEMIPHMCPAKHTDYFYSFVKVAVKPAQIKDLMSISGSVVYDPLKNLISARCATIEANIATLKLVTDILLGNKVEMPKLDIQYQDLNSAHANGSYGKLINSTSDPGRVKQYYAELCDNVGKLGQGLNQGFWSGAFSIQNNKCFPPDKPDKAEKQTGGKPNKPDKPARKGGKPNKPDKPARKGGKPNKPDKEFADQEDVYYKKYQKYKGKYLQLRNL